MFIFIWIFKLAVWLAAQVGIGLLVDNLIFGPPNSKKEKQRDPDQPTPAKRQTTS